MNALIQELIRAAKSKAVWVLVLSALLGALNALVPQVNPHLASVVTVAVTLVGIVLSRLENQTALNTPVPKP